MNVSKLVVALVAALLLAPRAMPAQIDLPPSNALIVLNDGSEVRVGSQGRIEATARTIKADRTGRMELRGDVRIKIVHDGFEALTIATSSAVIIRVLPEKAG